MANPATPAAPKEKKKFQVPHSFVIILGIVLVMRLQRQPYLYGHPLRRRL